MTPDDPDPQDAPKFNRAPGVDDLVSDSAYGNQGYQPERGAVDGGQVPVDELHETHLEAEQALRELDEQLPDPLTLTRSVTELRATAEAYARLDPEYRDGRG